jgi:hypothetical protein
MAITEMQNSVRCQHIKLSGDPCQAPARRGTDYCLFHAAEHTPNAGVAFPIVEDATSVQFALGRVLHGLQGDSIDFRRAALMFSGLRIARANLKQLGFERGDPVPAPAPNKTREDPLEGLPSLAEILLKRLDEIQAENAAEAGRPAPPPLDIEEARAHGSLGDLLLDRLQIVEDPPPTSAPSPNRAT